MAQQATSVPGIDGRRLLASLGTHGGALLEVALSAHHFRRAWVARERKWVQLLLLGHRMFGVGRLLVETLVAGRLVEVVVVDPEGAVLVRRMRLVASVLLLLRLRMLLLRLHLVRVVLAGLASQTLRLEGARLVAGSVRVPVLRVQAA